LGAALRRARKAKGLTLKQVAEATRRAESHASRWENGHLVPTSEDLGAMLHIFDIIGEERDRVIQLKREIENPDWVAPGIGEQLAALTENERDAKTIIYVEPQLIPGLLQTEDYAYRIIERHGASPAQARHDTLIRMGRQAVLRRRNPPEFVAAIGEGALRFPPCGASIMVGQLAQLINLGKQANITIRVVPQQLGYYSPAIFGSFVFVETNSGRSIVVVESAASSTTLTTMRAIHEYRDASTRIANEALSAEKSAALIGKILKEMESNV
jgi:transcriptional regulator with XRE-family HTH domain